MIYLMESTINAALQIITHVVSAAKIWEKGLGNSFLITFQILLKDSRPLCIIK